MGEQLPRVLIGVENVGICPVLVAGGRMVYAHPEVLKDESDRICAQALTTLAPAAEEMARAAAAGRRAAPMQLACPVAGCGARFELRVMSPDETVRAFSAAQGGARRTGRATGLRRAEAATAAPSVRPGAEPGVPSAPSVRPRAKPGVSATHRKTEVLPRAGTGTISRRFTAVTRTEPFLSRLGADVVREIVTLSTVRRFPGPTVLIEEGQEGQALYIVGDGEVEVVRRSEDGQEVVLATVGKGNCLGEISLVTEQPTSATVRTKGENVAVLALSRETFTDLLGRHPTLHKQFSRIIAERLYDMNVKLEAEAARGLTGRLSMIGVVDLVQTLHASRRTGTLVIRDGSGQTANVGFREGEVVSAVLGDEYGPEAFYKLVEWQEGGFSFEGGELPPEEAAAVDGGTMGLLMEALRRMDEKGAGR